MDLMAITTNHLLINAAIGWATAQVLKTIINAIVNRTLDFSRLVGDGGMPSAHSATVTAVAVTAGMEYGLDSGVFAVAVIFAMIVMHDAMGVRLEAGKHAKILNDLVKSINGEESPEIVLKEFVGHTPFQVVIGAILGGVIAFFLS